jgi:cyclopropane-fatty-acyl-phospholipid synthase
MDLVMTTELMQHMKNYEQIMKQIHGFLKPGTGKLFVQADTHKNISLGNTPSDDLILYCCKGFLMLDHWCLNGTHYAKTAQAWLKMLDQSWKKGSLKPILAFAYGNGKEQQWYNYWHFQFLRIAEQWSLNRGEEYITSHYLLQRG